MKRQLLTSESFMETILYYNAAGTLSFVLQQQLNNTTVLNHLQSYTRPVHTALHFLHQSSKKIFLNCCCKNANSGICPRSKDLIFTLKNVIWISGFLSKIRHTGLSGMSLTSPVWNTETNSFQVRLIKTISSRCFVKCFEISLHLLPLVIS